MICNTAFYGHYKQRYARREYTIEDVPLLKMMEIMSFKDVEFEPIKFNENFTK